MKTTTTTKAAVVTSIWKMCKKMQPNRFLESKPNPKKPNLFLEAELTADRTPAKEPNLWKREGEALTSPGHPLTNLTTVKLSRKRCPKTSGRTCVESMLCKVHPELYITPLTQPIMNAPDLYHFRMLGILCCLEAEESRMVVCGLVGWSDLIWSGCLVLRWWSVLMVWFGGSDDGLLWYSDVVVWAGVRFDGIVTWLSVEVCL